MQTEPFKIITPLAPRVPILISVPHCGVLFPDEIKNDYNQELIKAPDDTDWFVDQLYDFATEMGITMITAQYSRWVIDINRDPESKPLYDDGRIITELCPTATFAGEDIYKEGCKPNEDEVKRRITAYYNPYYTKITELLEDLKKEFGQVIFWDSHSIREYVPLIRKDKFPDLILGDNDGKTAHPSLSKSALENLEKSGLEVRHNTPFKGGHLTRYFGQPHNNQHGLQLEMTKVNYMDDQEVNYHTQRAEKIRTMLKEVFQGLLVKLEELK
ncbi:MAG TPA: N-formylglutamate amidohydrolase [Fulvivirga sp.]|nr:N-formylglutamate amidohydrolase [Fulvivirga sp.]